MREQLKIISEKEMERIRNKWKDFPIPAEDEKKLIEATQATAANLFRLIEIGVNHGVFSEKNLQELSELSPYYLRTTSTTCYFFGLEIRTWKRKVEFEEIASYLITAALPLVNYHAVLISLLVRHDALKKGKARSISSALAEIASGITHHSFFAGMTRSAIEEGICDYSIRVEQYFELFTLLRSLKGIMVELVDQKCKK